VLDSAMKTKTAFPPPPNGRVERYEAIVIGAGQAGLATAYHLAQRDIDLTIVTDEVRVGDNWRKRWDSLRLFTPAKYSSLPGMPFPASPYHFADKDEVGDYLERYAERFELPVRTRTRATTLRREGHRFVLHVDGGGVRLEAASVVVATGAFQRPRTPALARELAPEIHQLHSSEYKNPFTLPDGPVLVVGAGNSGAQIALELARYRKVWLAGRDTGHMPRRVLGRDVFDWIWPVMNRARTDTRLGRMVRARSKAGGDPLLGIPERALRDAGVVRVGRVTEAKGGLPSCDGQVIAPNAIVWCTGFAPDYSWIDVPVAGADGYPRHARGGSSDVPGLYFMGLRFQYRMNSALIGGVAADSAWVAEQVARRVFAEAVTA
jgi:putative flavoprotein involved in K+ transport